jgi:hypothetical protein
MPDFVRVRLENGSEASVSPAFAKRHDLTPLDKPASKNGVALPAKHNPLKKPAASPAVVTPPKEN